MLTFYHSSSLGARLEILWELTGTATRNADGSVIMENSPNDVEHPAAKVLDTASDDPTPTVDPNNPDSWATKLDGLLAPIQATAANTQTGRFIIETTQWGTIQRPDYCAVLYQVGSATPLRVVSAVPASVIGMPMDALFVIGVNVADQKIGINAVQDRAVANTLISHLISGIFYIHEKAFGWVFKRL